MNEAPEHGDATAPRHRPRKVLSREQLAAAARRQVESAAACPSRPRRRPSTWRVGLWVVECVVLLVLLESFVLKPMQARRAAARVTVAPPLPPPVAVAPLGAEGRELPGLREVVPAYLAPLTGLAEGSATMRVAQESYSRQARLPVAVENRIGMRFRLVPPGTATLGSPVGESGRGDGEVPHVFVAPEPFYLGAYEVTQEEWSRVVAENPSHYKGPRRPVEEITWYDCQRFLAALCQQEGLPEGTYRLPSEQEWEYACRAGTATAYCCGDDPRELDSFATHGGNGGSGTTAVGGKRPNALGLYDLHGNVWEWCLNRFAPYGNDDRPADPEHESWRCLRGGNWYVPPEDCRSAGRNRLPPASKGNMLGFRVLRAVTLPAPAPAPDSPAAPTVPPSAPATP